MENGNPGTAATPEELQKQLEIEAKRRKDTQAAYTKSQQELKALKASMRVLEETVGSLPVKETEEMAELKLTDPDEWYKKKQEAEKAAREEIKAKVTNVMTEAEKSAELERRAQVLAEFNQSHPDFQLTDEAIEFDVPQRLKTQLEKGEVSFDDWLPMVRDYLLKPKKVGSTEQTLDQPDLTKLGGGNVPSKTAQAVDIVASYKKEIY